MRLLHFAIAVAGLVALTTALAAQEPDTLSAAQRAGLALARLGAGQRVRIVTRDSEFVEGSVMAASARPDRKSTRLNSSHVRISYAVFCLKKKKNIIQAEKTL